MADECIYLLYLRKGQTAYSLDFIPKKGPDSYKLLKKK